MPTEIERASPPPATSPEGLAGAIEAVLLTADRPVSGARLAEALAGPLGLAEPLAPRDIQEAVAALNEAHTRGSRSFRIETVAGGYRVMTLPEYAPCLAAFEKQRAASRLSRAAVETLAVVAYRQPITRAHLEAVRGVACGEILKTLIERRLVAVKGRAEELGRPLLYGTTKEFLDLFGLGSIKDLPTATELAPPVPPGDAPR